MSASLTGVATRQLMQTTHVSGVRKVKHGGVPVRGKSTFANQATLARLPVPRLTAHENIPAQFAVDPKYGNTLSRWLKSIEPLVHGKELEEAKKAVEDFGKAGGAGEALTKALRQRALDFPDSSWLAKWWMSWAYMGYRDSVVVNVSYHYIFDEFPNAATQLERAATMTASFVKAMILIRQEKLQPDEIKGVPQCMSSYKNMFGTCRIPAKPDDYIIYATPQECRHIVVACKNLFFKMSVFDDSGLPLSIPTLHHGLAAIMKEASSLTGSQPPIGILTTQHRDTWTDIRKELLADSLNHASIRDIETAAFVLNLDDYNPSGRELTCKTLLHGGGSKVSSSNRYFDKSFNIIIFPDGRAGLVGEHSGIDGYPATVVSDMVWEMTASPERFHEISAATSETSTSSTVSHELIRFNPKTPKLDQYIQEAAKYHDENVSKVDMTLLEFHSYGTKFIKSAGVSPDGYVQMALQLAYYRLHKAVSPVYESCSTRQYLHGRTEVGRALSNDAVAFVNAMDDPNLSAMDKYAVFKKACESHIGYIRDASDGYGCDRHILGMKLIAQETPELKQFASHPFFSLPAHSKTTHWSLSTSQLPSKHSITGFGPVVADGYGIFYNLRANTLNFHVSAFTNSPRDVHKFSSSLQQTLLDLQHMCKAAHVSAKL